MKKFAVELFRLNGGKPGYYLANLRDTKYYYCGAESEDIKTTLQSLEIAGGHNSHWWIGYRWRRDHLPRDIVQVPTVFPPVLHCKQRQPEAIATATSVIV